MLAQAGSTPNSGEFCSRHTDNSRATKDGSRVELSVTRGGTSDVPVVVVAVDGEVDVYAAPALRDGLTDLLNEGSSVVVDLSEVGFLDSTGLGALVAARTAASEHGVELPLVCTHQRILKLFTITGLDGVFRIYDSVDAALASLDATADSAE
jgi:anti-sigma B factor antagonist